MVLSVEVNSFTIVFINVYLNSDVWKTVTQQQYLESLATIESYISELQYDSVFVVGDFNADPFSGRAWDNLSQFIQRNLFKCFDVDFLDENSCTFVGYGNSVSRWLDHVIGKEHGNVKVTGAKILYDIVGSDHLPLEATIQVGVATHFRNRLSSSPSLITCNQPLVSHVNWVKLTVTDFSDIMNKVDRELHDLCSLPVHECLTVGCRDQEHLKTIDHIYNLITSSVQKCSKNYVRGSIKKNKYKVIPGWNRCVKVLHQTAREKFLAWVKHGKGRGTVQHEEMLESRKEFKKALKDCKANEQEERNQSIMETFMLRNKTQFWSEVKKSKQHKVSDVIDSKCSNGEIVNLFCERFLPIQTDCNNNDDKEICNRIKAHWPTSRKMNLNVSCVTVKKLISRLNIGEGHDLIHTVFLRNASDFFLQNLANFFNACFIHCYLPRDLLKGTITPIVKDPKKCDTESCNYRPVMQSSCLLKIFEIYILEILSEKLILNYRQFGFRSRSCTTDACFILKEVMKKYSNCKQSAVATFIDLTKAFDNVDHFILAEKFFNSDVPIDVTLIVLHYLRNQTANIKWKNVYSEYRIIEKGVRQGGVLSPFLFNFYINTIISEVVKSNIGCKFGDIRCNILAYADDIVLLADKVSHMEILYRNFCFLIREHRLKINREKTKCMIFSNNSNQNSLYLSLNGDLLEVVDSFKYLGHKLLFNFKDVDDIAFRLNCFYASFNNIMRNFTTVSREVLLFLFNAFCKPDYGLPLWSHGTSFNSRIFNVFKTAFSKSLKRINGVPAFASSHITADRCGQLLLHHHVALTQARYCKRLLNLHNPIMRHNIPFIKEGSLMQHTINHFRHVYSVDVLDEDLDVLTSRVHWVQRHEERRAGTCLYYGY